MTRSVAESLLGAILADPADDSARLVYADELEMQGKQKMAEFIRVQIELAKRGCVDVWCEKIHRDKYEIGKRCEMADECRQLRLRERELWTGCHVHLEGIPDEWIPTLAYGCYPEEKACVFFFRGFADVVICRCEDWLRHGRELVRMQPVERVILNDWSAHGLPGFFQLGMSNMLAWELNRHGLLVVANCFQSKEDADNYQSAAVIAWAKAGKG